MCSSFTPHNFSQTITLLALFAFCSVFRTVAIAVFNLCEWRRTRTPHNQIMQHVFFSFILFSFSFVLFLSKLNLMAFVGSKSYFCNFFFFGPVLSDWIHGDFSIRRVSVLNDYYSSTSTSTSSLNITVTAHFGCRVQLTVC